MAIVNKSEPIITGLIDFCVLVGSLYLTLVLRYHQIPNEGLVRIHEMPFVIIFLYSVVIFYILGLYGRTIFFARSAMPLAIVKAQVFNILVAIALFYFIPSFTVTPKVTLFLYALLSTALLIAWRLGFYSAFSRRKKYPAIVIAEGAEVAELVQEMKVNPRIELSCVAVVSPQSSVEEVVERITSTGLDIQYIVADADSDHMERLLPKLYSLYFAKVQIVDIHDLYEESFSRIPLSRMSYAWIMSTVSPVTSGVFAFGKRAIDIFFGIVITFVTALVYPFVALAIKLEDRGSVFIRQERVGQFGKSIHYYKFRSMQRNDSGKWVAESAQTENKITRVGHFIRKTRIDELPQGLAVLKGDMSLIGPRGDIAGLHERLEQEIPYYAVRTIVKPGLTGWAQVNQNKPPQSVEETKVRLSYDLYYIKHRSLALELQIVLKTFKTLLSREGM